MAKKETTATTKETYYYALGRRKTAVATVRLYANAGQSTVNGKELVQVYPHSYEQVQLFKPFEVGGLKADQFWFTAKVSGSGVTSQLEAIRLGLARAIVKMDPTLKKPLKQAKLLTRDPRMVERKKPGLHKARRAEQFSKR